jgi:hypothetical protein
MAEPPLWGALWIEGRDVSITLITSVALRRGFPMPNCPPNVAGVYCRDGARAGAVTARDTPVSSQSFAKQAVFAHHYWLARR